MDEFDEAPKRELREEMIERVERGFQGWTRADGTYVDGDGRREYRRLYGSRWKTHYEDDRGHAMATLARSGVSSADQSGATPYTRHTSIVTAGRRVGATLDRMRDAESTSDARLAALVSGGTGGTPDSEQEPDPVAQARRWAEEALAEEKSQSPQPDALASSSRIEPPATLAAPVTDPAAGVQAPGRGRRSVPCPKCGASNAPHRTECLMCGKRLPAQGGSV